MLLYMPERKTGTKWLYFILTYNQNVANRGEPLRTMYSEDIPYTIERIDSLSPSEKRYNWEVSFGLQAVDGLSPSEYMLSLAEENISGNKLYLEISDEIEDYHSGRASEEEREADLVSLRIARILSENAFVFTPVALNGIHRNLFDGVLSPEIPLGEYRQYNITKQERVLSGKSVAYSPHYLIKDTLAYDFGNEKNFDNSALSKEEKAHHVMGFISSVWQIHPFGEGNTRTCAVFAVLYLRSLGFQIDNTPFHKHSKYFRDALALDNFPESRNPEYLRLFTENLLLSGKHDLIPEIPAVGS